MLFVLYAYRSLTARARTNLITTLAVALFVAGSTLGLGFYLGLEQMLHTAAPENVVVIARGANSEGTSTMPIDTARKVVLVDGIRQVEGQPLAARELLTRVYVESDDFSTYRTPLPIRGIDTQSFAVHHAKLSQGTEPAPGSLDLVIGRRVALKIGSEVALPAGPAKVVGVFEAGGSPYEDELWTPRAALELHVKAKISSSVTLVAESASAVPALVERINANKDLKAQAVPLAKLREDKFGLRSLATTVFVLLVLLAIVAISSITMTMHAATVVRLPEMAALAAIGIRRSVLRRILLLESMLLAVVGALLGLGASKLLASQLGAVTIRESPVDLSIGVLLFAVGLGLALVVGLAGGLPSALSVGRLDIVKTLR